MDVKSLKGIAIVSIEDGEKLGTVDDVIFNLDNKQVIAFRLSRSGIFRSGRNLIAMQDVESIGPDAVMIRDRGKVREEKNEREIHGRPDLKGIGSLRVVTQDGTYVGNLATVHIDQKTGALTQLEVSGGNFMDMLRRNVEVPVNDVVSIGNDVVVVPNRYGTKGTEEDEEQSPDDTTEVIQ